MSRVEWDKSRSALKLAANTIINAPKELRYTITCSVCKGTGHMSFKCPWKPFFNKDGKCKNPWGVNDAEKQRTERHKNSKRNNPFDEDYNGNRLRAKRQRGQKQHEKCELPKRAPGYVKIEQDTTKVFSEEDYEGWGKSDQNMVWREVSTTPIKSEILDIAAGFNANGNERVGETDDSGVDKLVPQPKPTSIIEHDTNDVLKPGQTWEWMDDDETTSWACKMEKLDTVGWWPFNEPVVLSKPTTDKRPDQFRGAELVHKEPTYSLIRYTRRPALFGFPVWFSKTTDLVVSEEVATQVLTASNVNYSLNHDAIFNRITQAAKTVSKVNEDRYMVLNNYFPRNDTIVFANNIAKCYFWDRRNLKLGVDFMRCQDIIKPK